MKYLSAILLFFIAIPPLYAKSLEERICGNKFSSATLSSDWNIDKSLTFCQMYQHLCNEEMKEIEFQKSKEKLSQTFCASASCFNENQKVELQKCFYQATSQMFHYKIKRQETGGTESSTFTLLMTDKDICYEDCKTIKNKFLPFSFLETQGLTRESCQKCFMERNDDINLDKNSISFPEIGQKFYRGQKCFELCKDPNNSIINKTLSLACQKCVGINGHKGDSFRFIKSKNGDCFEVENEKEMKPTIPEACRSDKTTYTSVYTNKDFTFSFFSSRQGSPCIEIDNQSGGRLLSRQTDQSYCEEKPLNNDKNRNMPVEKISPSTIPASSTQPSGGLSR